jgi:signal transduction histidine kinase
MPLPRFARLARSADDRVLGGVCAGIARELGVDPTLVRLVFALLALAGGAGIVLYGALWFVLEPSPRRSPWIAALLLLAAGSLVLHGFGLSDNAVLAVALIGGGLALIWRKGASLRTDEPFSLLGVALAVAGATVLLARGGVTFAFLAPGAVVAALLMIVGPWLWQLSIERTERIRVAERAEVAARVHDSVLQTLALIQRHSEEPRRVASLARRQERELRTWLYGDGSADADTLAGALAAAAGEVEELHGVRIELARGGDTPLTDDLRPLVLAAREAMQNAAKFSGADEVSVYAEADDERVSVFVRDRGAGFDRATVPADRRGLAESIEGRMARAGGSASIVTAPGGGTEVELALPRRPV